MDEVSARAKLATAEPGLTVSVPRSEVEAALEEEGADLVLDVVRSNGDHEERRVVLALDEEMLRRLVEQDGEQIMIAIDRSPRVASALTSGRSLTPVSRTSSSGRAPLLSTAR